MLKALADTMGGYLYVYVLPLTRHSYYAGNIKYHNAKRLFELFDELKNFLHTNGVGWLKPNIENKHVKTPPIVITPPQSSVSCDGLITYPAGWFFHKFLPFIFENPSRRGRLNFISVAAGAAEASFSHYVKKKRHTLNRRRIRNAGDYGPVSVPLPFLDDENTPNRCA